MARIWIDLETTGLDPAAGFILELAVVATEPEAPEYREVAAQSWVVLPGDAGWLNTLDPYVAEMHTKSGLLDDVVERGVPVHEVERELLKFLSFFGNPAPGREPIAGSSPHFDAGWLAVHMPTARRYFNHRVHCASAIKQFVVDCGHELPRRQEPAHRALGDIRYSIELCRQAAQFVIPGRSVLA